MRTLVLGLVLLAACGDDSGSADASTVPAMVTITGQATAQPSGNALAGVAIVAYRNSNESTPVAMTTTDASGNYTLVVTTDGKPLDGFIKATLSTYLDTYLYPPFVLTADFAGASINMVTSGTLDLLANLACSADQVTTNGVIALLVVDAMEMPAAGAMVSSSPAANKICYNAGGYPSRNATMTDTDGLAYLFNVTGDASVSASKSGITFMSHSVKARAGAFTTTVIQP